MLWIYEELVTQSKQANKQPIQSGQKIWLHVSPEFILGCDMRERSRYSWSWDKEDLYQNRKSINTKGNFGKLHYEELHIKRHS